MADHTPNFSCSDPALSDVSVTDEVWKIRVVGPSHPQSIIAIAVIQVLYVIIGVPWNATVLAVILIKRLFKEPTYLFLLNMVLADLVVLLIMPFNIASSFPMSFLIGNSDQTRCQVCHTIIITTLILTNVSVFALALLSMDRLIYIKWPFIYEKIASMKTVFLILAITWATSIVITLPPVFGFGEIKFANPFGSCSLITVGRNRISLNIIYVALLLAVLSIPLFATFIANVWLLIIVCGGLRTRYTKTRNSMKNTTKRTHLQKEKSTAELKGGYQKQQLHLIQVFGVIFL